MRILLVEDDKNLLETLSFQLTHAGFIVDTCENGEDALYYITENIHDLIPFNRPRRAFRQNHWLRLRGRRLPGQTICF